MEVCGTPGTIRYSSHQNRFKSRAPLTWLLRTTLLSKEMSAVPTQLIFGESKIELFVLTVGVLGAISLWVNQVGIHGIGAPRIKLHQWNTLCFIFNLNRGAGT